MILSRGMVTLLQWEGVGSIRMASVETKGCGEVPGGEVWWLDEDVV